MVEEWVYVDMSGGVLVWKCLDRQLDSDFGCVEAKVCEGSYRGKKDAFGLVDGVNWWPMMWVIGSSNRRSGLNPIMSQSPGRLSLVRMCTRSPASQLIEMAYWQSNILSDRWQRLYCSISLREFPPAPVCGGSMKKQVPDPLRSHVAKSCHG